MNCARQAMNLLAPRPLVPLASGMMRIRVLRLSTALGCLAVSAAALATPASAPAGLFQTYNASAFQTAWEQEKARLAALARSQGVREATIQAVIPNLQANSR